MINFNLNNQVTYNSQLKPCRGIQSPSFSGLYKEFTSMNNDVESKFVKLLSDYSDYKETDKSFKVKFVKLSKDYLNNEKPKEIPNWYKNVVKSYSKINDSDIEGIENRSAITTADFRYLVLKVLQNFRSQDKHLDILKKDYSKYINLDLEG